MKKYVYLVGLFLALPVVCAQTPDTVFLEELTWTEVRDAIATGTTTVIVPTAGTEQNGPHMVLGKHKYRMEWASKEIAQRLGDTLVAPVMTYVPEGDIEPPSGHMRYAGTITLPDEVFRQVLEYAARSLKVHGFTDILFIGDSGPNQPGMKEVSERLNQEWETDNTRVHFVSDYYSNHGFEDWLRSQGETEVAIGRHAGLMDTSLLLAVAPEHIRLDGLTIGSGMDVDGVDGDPTKATAEYGRVGMESLVAAAVRQIEDLMAAE